MMRNTIQFQQKRNNAQLVVTLTSIGLLILTFITIFSIGAHLGDGTPYSTGFETGKLVAKILHSVTFKISLVLGSTSALLLSWYRNKSILWAFLHAILSWSYIFYFTLTRRQNKGIN